MLKNFLIKTFLLVAFIFGIFVAQTEAASLAQSVKGDLKISMLNIGYGDAILIRTSEQTILIDTAYTTGQKLFVDELEKFSVTKIDKIILTHPHTDHIGGAKLLFDPTAQELATYPYLKKISVAEVYDNGIAFPSKVYRNYLKALKKKGMTRQSLKVGDTLDLGGGVKFKVLFPKAEFVTFVNEKNIRDNKYNDPREYNINNGSIVGKLTYKNFSMMFTGDCEKESEATIVKTYSAKDLKCDVLKGAHHGSATSSTKDFVAAVKPTCVLLSSTNRDKDISQEHPHLNPLKNYLAQGVNKKNIFSTRFNGTITITSNGNKFSVAPENKTNWLDDWIAQKEKREQEKKQKK